MSDGTDNITDDAALAVLNGILAEMVEIGESHAGTISELPEEHRVDAMQINTMLSVATVLLFKANERKDIAFARELVEVWTSETMQQLVALAFREEIAAAYKTIDDGIDSLEKLVNDEETNDSSSGPGA
jgi:hypothetical protein